MNLVIINPTSTIGGIMACKEVEFPMEYPEIQNLKKELGITEPFVAVASFREEWCRACIGFDCLNDVISEFENHESDYRFVYGKFDFDNPLDMAECVVDNKSYIDMKLIEDCTNDDESIDTYFQYVKAMNSEYWNEFNKMKSEKSVSEIVDLYEKIKNYDFDLLYAIVECDLADDVFEAAQYCDEYDVTLSRGDTIRDYINDKVDNQLYNLPSWMHDCIDNYIPSSAWEDYCDHESDLGVELYDTDYGLLIVG